MSETLGSSIEKFLRDDEKDQYWRAIELHEKFVPPGKDRLLEVKAILEEGVKHGLYKRGIFTKNKVTTVGYQFKRREKQTITKDDVGKVSDILGGWERKE